jgi:rod shape-determining protein MreC
LLEIIAFVFIFQHHSYHKSKFVNSSNVITGSVYSSINSVNEFFHLKSENQKLNEENARLKNLLQKQNSTSTLTNYEVINDIEHGQKYEYTTAKIINNNFTKQNNYLTLNKGKNQGLKSDLGVINSKGVIGVIKSTSNNFSSVLSILNNYSRVNIRLKNSNHFGTMSWNGDDYNVVQITDIPRQAILKVGDTIITGGKSAIFPEGILIGFVKDFVFENNQYKLINISLFNDMSSLGQVQVVKNLYREEQLTLENKLENE